MEEKCIGGEVRDGILWTSEEIKLSCKLHACVAYKSTDMNQLGQCKQRRTQNKQQ